MTEYDNMDIIITPTSNTWFLLIYDSTSHINDLHVRPLRKLKTFTSNSLPHGNMQQKLYLTVLFFRIQALHLHFHLTTKYFSIWLDKYEGYPVQLSGWVNNLKKKKNSLESTNYNFYNCNWINKSVFARHKVIKRKPKTISFNFFCIKSTFIIFESYMNHKTK